LQAKPSARSRHPWFFLGMMMFLFQCGLPVRAQNPAVPSNDAPLETRREYGNNAATKANAAAATLTPAQKMKSAHYLPPPSTLRTPGISTRRKSRLSAVW
jgi:hypothetical protein